MALTLADKVTMLRLALAPAIVAAYLLLPIDHMLCFWVAGWLCAFAEYSDLADGRIARRRGEVSDFGKLADPFCDVIYRMSVFLVYLLPAGGVGYPVWPSGTNDHGVPDASALAAVHQLVFAPQNDDGLFRAGLVPWLPVYLMVMREIVAGALRALAATRGLVLAARTSGKIKAWLQGITLITLMGLPAFWFHLYPWHLTVAFWATWLCAVVSVVSMLEYIWVNRAVLAQLLQRKT
jgi:CDP-diacylglycerol--glycerol-3-phosphate 3-phosphatidyltransferase